MRLLTTLILAVNLLVGCGPSQHGNQKPKQDLVKVCRGDHGSGRVMCEWVSRDEIRDLMRQMPSSK